MSQQSSDDEIKHLQLLLDTYIKRLRVLELQHAQFGAYVPPHIVLEINDLQQQIAATRARLAALQPASSIAVEAPPAATGVTPASNEAPPANRAAAATAASVAPESSVAPAAAANTAPAATPAQQQAYSVALLQILATHFNLSELRMLCFELQVDDEELAGQTKGEKAQALVAYMQRHGRIAELEQKCRQLRPRADWRVLEQAR